jgi:peptide-methionine (S)-S-oxide reductase
MPVSLEGCTFCTADGYHQQYLDRNINGHAGTRVSCSIGVALAKG